MFDQDGVDRLLSENRIVFSARGKPRMKTYLKDLPGIAVHDVWDRYQAHQRSGPRTARLPNPETSRPP